MSEPIDPVQRYKGLVAVAARHAVSTKMIGTLVWTCVENFRPLSVVLSPLSDELFRINEVHEEFVGRARQTGGELLEREPVFSQTADDLRTLRGADVHTASVVAAHVDSYLMAERLIEGEGYLTPSTRERIYAAQSLELGSGTEIELRRPNWGEERSPSKLSEVFCFGASLLQAGGIIDGFAPAKLPPLAINVGVGSKDGTDPALERFRSGLAAFGGVEMMQRAVLQWNALHFNEAVQRVVRPSFGNLGAPMDYLSRDLRSGAVASPLFDGLTAVGVEAHEAGALTVRAYAMQSGVRMLRHSQIFEEAYVAQTAGSWREDLVSDARSFAPKVGTVIKEAVRASAQPLGIDGGNYRRPGPSFML